jgi:hypothetical protein
MVAVWTGIQHYCNTTIDYSRLENFLAEKQWKNADIETSKIINKIIIRELDTKYFWGYSLLPLSHGDRFRLITGTLKCESLQKIDHLWTEYSSDNYGFSVQAKIASTIWNIISDDVIFQKISQQYSEYRKHGVSYPNTKTSFDALFLDKKKAEQVRIFRETVKYDNLKYSLEEVYLMSNEPEKHRGLLPSALWSYDNTPAATHYPMGIIRNYIKCQN